MEALRFNDGKPELHRLWQFGSALTKLARVMSQGSIKYEDGNWLRGGKPDAEYLDSHDRHMLAFANGEEYDPETGAHHLAHAVWNLLALLRLNRSDAPDLSPEFDQAAFVARWGAGADAKERTYAPPR